jgi:secondary thiamine-phosphate synthase enzyme
VEKINVKTNSRTELVDLTTKVQAVVNKAKVRDGICFLFCPHTTAGLTINENADPSVQQDIVNTLSRVIPQGRDYTHSEGNSDSHIKSSLLGSSLSIFIETGELCLGTWQGIYFCESDGPRQREVWIKLVGSI